MQEKTLGEIARNAFYALDILDSGFDWQAVADAVIAEYERRQWRPWPDGTNDDTAEHPPDETPVDIYCGNWAGKDRLIGKISRRCGTYGPSGASHWRLLPAPPKEARDAGK